MIGENVLMLKPYLARLVTDRGRWFLAAVLLCATAHASAHEIRPSIADLTRAGDVVTLELRLNLESVLAGIPPGHEDTDTADEAPEYDRLRALEPAALQSRANSLLPSLIEGIELDSGAQRLPLQLESLVVPDVPDLRLARDSRVRLSTTLPVNEAQLQLAWAERYGPLILRAGDVASPTAFNQYLLAGQRSDAFELPATGTVTEARGAMRVLLDYLRIGFVHIVPLGLDHILFVVALVLLAPAFRPIALQVTAFTIAHSITLALAAIGWLALPSSVVEPLIALSIVLVAVENLASARLHRYRLVLVFLFGLLHGLGFAGVLAEAGLSEGRFALSLFGFNAGVEIGQLSVVLACLAAFGWYRQSAHYRRRVLVPGSLVIGAIGLYWLVQRTAGLG